MLEADIAEVVGKGDEKFIFVEMGGSERFQRLIHHPSVRGDMLWLRREILGPVGEQVEVDIPAEIPLAEMAAGEHRLSTSVS